MFKRLLQRLGLAGEPPGVRAPRVAPGDLVSVADEDGRFAVMKVLAADEGGVHVRLYVQRFPHRPAAAELGELTTAPPDPTGEGPFSIGHMPISHRSFGGWQPEPITRVAVDEAELDGYRRWEEARGGYF